MMSLAKHLFAKLRALHMYYTCLNHALAVWCCEVHIFYLMPEVLQQRCCYLLLLLAGGDGLLLACLLLLVQLLGLSFSSWTCC
jgi:hypothetical protein